MPKIKIAAVSDLHGYLPPTPECDLLLVAGDICPLRNHNVDFQARWLDTEFRRWLKEQPADHIIGVAGNHDRVFQDYPRLIPQGLRWEYLQDRSTTFQGLKVYGTPWQPYFFDWSFNLYENDLAKKWKLIPDDTDILVLHGPPHGYGDFAPRVNADGGEHVGSESLTARLDELKQLKLAVFGHIHEGFGEWKRNGATLANVSYVDGRYQPRGVISTVELEVP